MAGLDLVTDQDQILEFLETSLPMFQVMEGDVGDAVTIAQEDGVASTFVVVQFGDIMPKSGDTGFCGPQNDGYYSIFRTLSVASTPRAARQAGSIINQLILKHRLASGASISKTFGGGSYILGESNSRPLNYAMLNSFQFPTNLQSPGSVVFP